MDNSWLDVRATNKKFLFQVPIILEKANEKYEPN